MSSNALIWMMEYPELERTHKDHWVQLISIAANIQSIFLEAQGQWVLGRMKDFLMEIYLCRADLFHRAVPQPEIATTLFNPQSWSLITHRLSFPMFICNTQNSEGSIFSFPGLLFFSFLKFDLLISSSLFLQTKCSFAGTGNLCS